MQFIISKLQQKSTWAGIAAIGLGLATLDMVGIVTGVGLILANA